MSAVQELAEDLELVRRIDWDEVDTLHFKSYHRFWEWVRANSVRVLWRAESDGEVYRYCVMYRDEPLLAIVHPTVDDFYIDESVAKSMLTKEYVAKKGYDRCKPVVVGAELYWLFHRLVELSAMVRFSTLSPEEAKKLLDMARFVKEAGEFLEESVDRAVKEYIEKVTTGELKDDRWRW